MSVLGSVLCVYTACGNRMVSRCCTCVCVFLCVCEGLQWLWQFSNTAHLTYLPPFGQRAVWISETVG